MAIATLPDHGPIEFVDARSLVALAFREFEVPERMSVGDAAKRWLHLSNPSGGYTGPFTFDGAPFLARPMDCLGPDFAYNTVAIMGPSQTFKSTVGDAWLFHTVMVDQADMMFVGPDRKTVSDYVQTQVDKALDLSPDVKGRLARNDQSNNTFLKQFIGCNFFAVWPVGSMARARPVPRLRFDDYDEIPTNVSGQGDPLQLFRGRQTTFEGFDKSYVNSSPALGSKRGIEAVVARGTDERWWVDCLQCNEPFRLAFEEVLHFRRDGTAEEARDTAVVVCPGCGRPHEWTDKRQLMATGRWIGKGEKAVPGGRAGELIKLDTASFRFDGLMGASTWGRLAFLYREAELQYELDDDEGELRAVYNTRIGVNYQPRTRGEEPITVDALRIRRDESDYGLGQVPPGVICLTAFVDVQVNRFEVVVVGWGFGFECWIIDRFAILSLEDGTTGIDPANRPEHWGTILEKVIKRRYPLRDAPDAEVRIMNTAVDTGGAPGVTDNAYSFWQSAVGLGLPPTAITLLKGGNNPKGRLLPPPTVDAKRQIKGLPEVELFVPNVNRLKDIVDARLRRSAVGQRFVHLPADLSDAHIAELRSEERDENGIWVRERHARNETWDGLIATYVPILRFGNSDPALKWVPAWARPSHPKPQPLVEAANDAQPPPPAGRPSVANKPAPTAHRPGRIRVRRMR